MLWDYVDGLLPEDIAMEISTSTDETLRARLDTIHQFNRQLTAGFPEVVPSLSLKTQLLETYKSMYLPETKTKSLSVVQWFFLPVAAFCFIASFYLILSSEPAQIEQLANQYSIAICFILAICFCYTLCVFILKYLNYSSNVQITIS